MLGKNLPGNYPVIDKFFDGVATSIKSLDINAKSYLNSSRLKSTVKLYIDKVAKFEGYKWNNVIIESEDIVEKALDLVVPSGGNATQKEVLQWLIDYGKKIGVKINVIIK